eukprot:7487254-Prorocentrum_lima.AAC.1
MSCGFGAAVTSTICAACQRLLHMPPRQSRSLDPIVFVRVCNLAPFSRGPLSLPRWPRAILGGQ